MTTEHDVAIVGAGPYGLSLAAHLSDQKSKFQIFGEPMQFWRDHMPKGMQLKSDGFASNLYDPKGCYTLRRYCEDHRLEYHDTTLPVRLDTFVKYGIAFQQRFVPHLRTNKVLDVDKTSKGFALRLDSDEMITARKVVVAAGIRDFRHLPSSLKPLPGSFITHSSDHHDLSAFKGRDVIVVGAGSSATDIAALLQGIGANVRLLARQRSVLFHNAADAKRTLLQRLRHPSSGIGPGLRARFYCDAPWLFHYFPGRLRSSIIRTTLGPAGGWFMRDRVIGRIPMLLGSNIEHAEIRNDRVHLKVRDADRTLIELVADHVIAATGYKPDARQFRFLSAEIQSRLKAVDGSPKLSSAMECSIPGLYFTGTITANSFGPVMRFAFGARFAAARIARALA
jgi:thioredoxin reductase